MAVVRRTGGVLCSALDERRAPSGQWTTQDDGWMDDSLTRLVLRPSDADTAAAAAAAAAVWHDGAPPLIVYCKADVFFLLCMDKQLYFGHTY